MSSTIATGSSPANWDVVITQWALDSYLDLKHRGVFTDAEYWGTLRPDVVLLKDGIPSPHPQFGNHKFWSNIFPDGFKMKWHQIGPGHVQLRLPVNLQPQKALLCESYVKRNALQEKRQLARFKTHANLIQAGRYVHRGSI